VFYLNRGACLVDMGEFDKAITDFTAAVILAPDDHRPYALRYNAHVCNGEMDKARMDGAEAHRLNPDWSMPKSADLIREGH
jgi:tetratricopeptide (TPR) repeat protein